MISTHHLLKVGAAWTSIVYTICFLGVALFPTIRPGFMRYGLHTSMDMGMNVISLGTFISGLVIWNIVAYLALWLFAFLFNKIQK